MTSTLRERLGVASVVLVGALVMLATMGRAVAGLVAALLVAYALWVRTPTDLELRRAMPAYVIAVAAQLLHFWEEFASGFYRLFPPVFGAPSWSSGGFLAFNLSWLVIFALAGWGLVRQWHPALLVALFLALGAGLLNGFAHLTLAAWRGGYFPGAYTAPLVFAAGGYLAIRLLRARPARDHAI
jgi:hypothetical protein